MQAVVDPSEDLQAAISKAQAALEAVEYRCADIQESLRSLERTKDLLSELPKKLRHPAMVPFGQLAFFPGHIVNTNECYIRSGEYHLHTTAYEAQQILGRREQRTKEQLAALQKDAGRLESSLQLLKDPLQLDLAESNEEGTAEISEEYDEFLHGCKVQGIGNTTANASSAQPTNPTSLSSKQTREARQESGDTDSDIFARLEQLELEEAQAESSAQTVTNEASLAKHVTRLNSDPEDPVPVERDVSNSLQAVSEPCIGLECPPVSAKGSSGHSLKKTVSWKDDADRTAPAESQKGIKPKPLVRGFFDKPSQRKSAIKPGSRAAATQPSEIAERAKHEPPAVIADVVERTPVRSSLEGGEASLPQAEPSGINAASQKQLSHGSDAVPRSAQSGQRLTGRIQNTPKALVSNAEDLESVSQQPKKVSRFKQQRALLKK